ncbi:hypothetical protein [Kozakia baliensis]|uniref:hypothetical protein n=1 Tax=Kozakia baliensis TaxID=153496 RepID=UPI0004962162|nr:hypothetical protein [Kozakia baliensis]
MSKTPSSHGGVSRRAAFSGVLALAGSVGVVSAVPASKDARLIDLTSQALAIDEEIIRQTEAWSDVLEAPPAHVEAQETALTQRLRQLQTDVASIQAQTLAGMKAKARLVLSSLPVNQHNRIDPDHSEFMVWTLCHDLLGLDA